MANIFDPDSIATIQIQDSAVTLPKININGGTELTTPAEDDELIIYDASAGVNKKITRINLFTEVSGVVNPIDIWFYQAIGV